MKDKPKQNLIRDLVYAIADLIREEGEIPRNEYNDPTSEWCEGRLEQVIRKVIDEHV